MCLGFRWLRVLLPYLALTTVSALHNLSHAPRLFDIDFVAVFAEVDFLYPEGRLWSIVTVPGLNLSVAEVKAGTEAIGPDNCQRLGAVIVDSDWFYGLTDCGFMPGSTYNHYAYIEVLGHAEEGHLYVQNFTVPPDPWPLPLGPYCFDRDVDYFGSTIEGFDLEVADAEACQTLCQASPACLHFRYVYSSGLADHQNCSRITAVRTIVGGQENPGVMVGPKSCESRSVNSFRPHAARVYTNPRPPTRSVPFALEVRGTYFDPDYDRVLLVAMDQPCRTVNAQGDYLVNGSRPATVTGWAQLPCNSSDRVDTSMLVCGSPPETVIFERAGLAKLCLCDAGRTPYGCDHLGGSINNFFERTIFPRVEIKGPDPNQTFYCPTGIPCRVENLKGFALTEGDRIMIRESCSPTGRPAVEAYTNASLPAPLPDGLLFDWAEPNRVTCPVTYSAAPCAVGRVCFCPAGRSCDTDDQFLTDAGEMVFYKRPEAPEGLKILQEDYESFTMRWDYPPHDGGGAILSYTLYFRNCTRGGFEDGPLAIITVPAQPGDNHQGKARNGTYQFRRVPFSYYEEDVLPMSRYCVQVSASNAAGEGDLSPEFPWTTDVHPPKDLHYPDPPVFLVHGEEMANMTPVVTTQDCRDKPTVVRSQPEVKAEDCEVQIYEVSPALPEGLSLDPSTGVISGTPVNISPRPQIYMVTATNSGGKSSTYISLGVIGRIDLDEGSPGQTHNPTVAFCLSSNGINDAVITFRMRDNDPWLAGCAGHPMNLRLTVVDTNRARLFSASGESLGASIARANAQPCGQLVLDTWSSSPSGFPPPGLCFWQHEVGKEEWAEIIFQGGVAFEAGAWYQLVVKMRIAIVTPAGVDVLKLDLMCAERASEERSASSSHLGVWTPASSLPRWRAELSRVPPTPLDTPTPNAPWINGEPLYVPGFGNPLLGEAPRGDPFPWGFPAPGSTTCYNVTSWCPTAPHQFANTPRDTAWYTDTDFPSYRVVTGVATLLTPVLTTMRFNPFTLFNATALPRPEVAAGNLQPLLADHQELTVDFTLALDSLGRVTLERELTICPSSPLQWPMWTQLPSCRVTAGPISIQCECESMQPKEHVAARCDRILLQFSEQLEVRSEVTVKVRVQSGTEASFTGFLPIRWYGQIKSRYGGLWGFHKTENAGLDVWPDLVVPGISPEVCADQCLQRLPSTGAAVPCRSFRFHRLDQDCYLSQFVETNLIPLRTDWPGNPFDNYEYEEQVVFSMSTSHYLSTPGLFFTDVVLHAHAFLDPPLPSPPPYGVGHFFPSYVGQLYVLVSLELVPVAPVFGTGDWRSQVLLVPPSGFRPVALSASLGTSPTPQGFGYCGGSFCSWFLNGGQALWPPAHYRFQITLHNPKEPKLPGEPWKIHISSTGYSPTGPAVTSLPVDVAHPLPVDGLLEGCSAHFAAARPVLPSGRFGQGTEDVVDIFFVLPRPWRSRTVLQVLLPENFSLPSACEARPLSPWLPQHLLACTLGGGHGVQVLFSGPLRAQSAVGLRLQPFALPADYAAVHPGQNHWPLLAQDAVQPKSLNVRLQVLQPVGDPGTPLRQAGEVTPSDACHPAVWSCGLDGLEWAARRIDVRPSQQRFARLAVRTGLAQPFRIPRSWAFAEFAVNATLTFQGALDEVLFLSPPHGFSVLALFSADVRVLFRDPLSGQLNLPTVLSLAEALAIARSTFVLQRGDEDEGGSVLRVQRLHGTFEPQGLYHLNISFQFPPSAVEPSLLDPATREPGRSGCANAWGLSLEGGGERLAAGFAEAEQLAYVSQFEVSCASQAVGAENLLTFSFVTMQHALPSSLPAGASLLLVFTLPGHFEHTDPAVAADFAAPFQVRSDGSGSQPQLGSTRPEVPAFQKLGCPSLVARSRGRVLHPVVSECAVNFNDAQDVVELALVIQRLAAATSHEVLLRVRNPDAASGTDVKTFGLSVFLLQPGQAFAQIPVPIEAEGPNSLLRVQEQILVEACSPLLLPLQAAVEYSYCTLDGRQTEVTISFIAPVFMPQPIRATVIAPAGYSIPWSCNASATSLVLPFIKRFDAILESMMVDCDVAHDGRSASFTITKDLQSIYFWHYFTIHATNARAEEAPATREQHSWSLILGSYAGGSADSVGLPAIDLRIITDLELRELPFTHSETSWALAFRFRTSMTISAGGYVVFHAPQPFSFPAEQCRGDNATNYGIAAGSPLFVPALATSPFLAVPEPGSAGPEPGLGRLPGLPARASCSVLEGGAALAVALLEGPLPEGRYEFRAAVAVEEQMAPLLQAADVEEGPLSPLRWTVRTWRPVFKQCSVCCAERRQPFLPNDAVPELELAERGVLEAYPSGIFRHRRIVPDSYGGWRYSNEAA